jgi:hypothetical protein
MSIVQVSQEHITMLSMNSIGRSNIKLYLRIEHALFIIYLSHIEPTHNKPNPSPIKTKSHQPCKQCRTIAQTLNENQTWSPIYKGVPPTSIIYMLAYNNRLYQYFAG